MAQTNFWDVTSILFESSKGIEFIFNRLLVTLISISLLHTYYLFFKRYYVGKYFRVPWFLYVIQIVDKHLLLKAVRDIWRFLKGPYNWPSYKLQGHQFVVQYKIVLIKPKPSLKVYSNKEMGLALSSYIDYSY